MKTALISGITGQDGSYLTELLLEKGIDKNTGNIIIKVDPKYFRPAEVDTLLGDSSKARNILGWEPKYDFKQLVKEMCENE